MNDVRLQSAIPQCLLRERSSLLMGGLEAEALGWPQLCSSSGWPPLSPMRSSCEKSDRQTLLFMPCEDLLYYPTPDPTGQLLVEERNASMPGAGSLMVCGITVCSIAEGSRSRRRAN